MRLTVYGIYLYTSMNENFNKARSCGVVEYKYLCCVHVGGNKKKHVFIATKLPCIPMIINSCAKSHDTPVVNIHTIFVDFLSHNS